MSTHDSLHRKCPFRPPDLSLLQHPYTECSTTLTINNRAAIRKQLDNKFALIGQECCQVTFPFAIRSLYYWWGSPLPQALFPSSTAGCSSWTLPHWGFGCHLHTISRLNQHHVHPAKLWNREEKHGEGLYSYCIVKKASGVYSLIACCLPRKNNPGKVQTEY